MIRAVLHRILWRLLAPWRAWLMRREARKVLRDLEAVGVSDDVLDAVRGIAGEDVRVVPRLGLIEGERVVAVRPIRNAAGYDVGTEVVTERPPSATATLNPGERVVSAREHAARLDAKAMKFSRDLLAGRFGPPPLTQSDLDAIADAVMMPLRTSFDVTPAKPRIEHERLPCGGSRQTCAEWVKSIEYVTDDDGVKWEVSTQTNRKTGETTRCRARVLSETTVDWENGETDVISRSTGPQEPMMPPNEATT